MGRELLKSSSSSGSNSSIPREVFYLFTHTLLSLIIPLSFLLLARLSTAQYYLQLQGLTYYSHHQYLYSPPPPLSSHPLIPYFLSLSLQINPCILYLLVFLITIASLIHAFTGKFLQPRLYTAWILLCVFQLCVGLGIEGSIIAGFYDQSEEMNFGVERSLLSRVVFLLGLHETTRVWGRMVVRPVLDDTVFGCVVRKEMWVERVAVGGSLGILWWWKLRDDVESLVVIAEAKREQMMVDVVGLIDEYFVGWWLYYLTITIGMVRVVKGLMWIIGSFRRRRATVEPSHEINDDKV